MKKEYYLLNRVVATVFVTTALMSQGCSYIKKMHEAEDRHWNSMTPEQRDFWRRKHLEWESERGQDHYRWIEEERRRK